MARVGEKELKSMPVKNALEGMQGKTAGVDITSSQRPGEVGDINIRGVRSIKAEQSPLYVVDGMVIQNGGIENINPSDIESIDILKMLPLPPFMVHVVQMGLSWLQLKR